MELRAQRAAWFIGWVEAEGGGSTLCVLLLGILLAPGHRAVRIHFFFGWCDKVQLSVGETVVGDRTVSPKGLW